MNFKISNKELTKTQEEFDEKIDSLEEMDSDLEYEIDDIEDSIKENFMEIKKLNSNIKNCEKNIAEAKKHLSKLKSKQLKVKNELSDLSKTREENEIIIGNLVAKEFKEFVLSFNDTNSMKKQLYNDTSTVDLLDLFCKSNKKFLLLRKLYFMSRNSVSVSLITTRYFDNIEVEKTSPTMTEIKQSSGKYLNRISCSRLTPLITAIKEIDNQIDSLKIGEIYPFNVPFLIGGQTSRNRSGYGCEWIGGGDYIEGTLYGEVTNFMIVGILIENRFS